MHLIVHSPDQPLFTVIVKKLTLPGSSGPFQVLQGHAPLVSTLQQGKIFYDTDGQEHVLAIGKGFVEVNDDKIIILVETYCSLNY